MLRADFLSLLLPGFWMTFREGYFSLNFALSRA